MFTPEELGLPSAPQWPEAPLTNRMASPHPQLFTGTPPNLSAWRSLGSPEG